VIGRGSLLGEFLKVNEVGFMLFYGVMKILNFKFKNFVKVAKNQIHHQHQFILQF
jgi:hypothetical protein